MKYLGQFYRFMYDFLVGDAWELFIGPIVSLIVAALLVAAGVPAGIAGAILVILVLAVGAFHLVLALRGAV